jgi:hypothetical protein
METDKGYRSTRRNPAQVPLRPPKISRDLTRDWSSLSLQLACTVTVIKFNITLKIFSRWDIRSSESNLEFERFLILSRCTCHVVSNGEREGWISVELEGCCWDLLIQENHMAAEIRTNIRTRFSSINVNVFYIVTLDWHGTEPRIPETRQLLLNRLIYR